MKGDAFVSEILIYPIKGLDPTPVESAVVGEKGSLEGDRVLAIFDEEGKVVSCKREKALHRVRAEYRLCEGVVVLKAGEEAEFSLSDAKSLSRWFSGFLGYRVIVRRIEEGLPDDRKARGPTIVSRETLEEVARWFGIDYEECLRRFRPNIIINAGDPFWEDRLVDDRGAVSFRLGEITFEGTGISKRCPVPTRNPWTGEVTKNFVKRFCQMREKLLPSWSPAERFRDTFYRLCVNTSPVGNQKGKKIRIGDPLVIL